MLGVSNARETNNPVYTQGLSRLLHSCLRVARPLYIARPLSRAVFSPAGAFFVFHVREALPTVFEFTDQDHRHLPATLLASFVKRLARLSLTASPAAITIIFPFVYNTLKCHPSLMLMIHREGITNTFEDPFLPEEPSPLRTRAIDSCLWELQTHIHHYAPPVGTLARIFSEPFTKPSYVLEDFLDHTYDTVRVPLFSSSISESLIPLVAIYRRHEAANRKRTSSDATASEIPFRKFTRRACEYSRHSARSLESVDTLRFVRVNHGDLCSRCRLVEIEALLSSRSTLMIAGIKLFLNILVTTQDMHKQK